MLRVLVCFVLSVVNFPSLAQAQDVKRALVKCVQQGLLDAQFDPNGVDGRVGGGTLAAALAWQDANPGADLIELNREPTPVTLRNWCYTLSPPTQLYGGLFQLIKKQDGTFAASDVGPVAIDFHEQAMWTRVRGVHRGATWENNVVPGTLTPSQKAFIERLPGQLEIFGTTKRISPDFFDGFGNVDVWADQNSRTYAISQVGEIRHMVVFNGDEPYHLIRAATVEVWADEVDAALDWAELDRAHGIKKP